MNRPDTSLPAARQADGAIALREAVMSDAHPIAVVHVRSFQAIYRRILPNHVLDCLSVTARARIWAQRIADADADQRRVVVADLDGRVAAFLYFGLTPDDDDSVGRTGHVFSIHTDPNLTGSGIGTTLMEYAASEMADAAFADATLWVVAENDGARRFYDRLGWHTDGARRTELLGLSGEPCAAHDAETIRYRLRLGAES
ncbi:MAG: GNAT family N-acetyltransferase [Actinomycetota bacterium]